MKYDVLLADSQTLTAAGITHLLSSREEFDVVDQVVQKDDLSIFVEKYHPALLIADYNLQGFISLEDLRLVREISPKTHVLIISGDSDKAAILEALQIPGVLGYLTKECSREEVMMAVQAVSKGEKFYCNKILDVILEKRFTPEAGEPVSSALTARETEILTLLASGQSTSRIADNLYLSPHTVQTHRKSIIKKLGIKSPTEFVIYAMDFGLIKPK